MLLNLQKQLIIRRMKLILLLCMLFSIVLVQQDWYLANNPVFVDQQTIGGKILKQGDIKIITFLTPVCRFCPQGKKMVDKFKSQLLQGHRDDVKFYFVNCNAQEKLCEQFSISLVPYIIVFNKHGKVIEELPGQRQPLYITSNKVRNAIHVVDIHEYQLQRALSLKNMRQQHIQGQQKIPQKHKNIEPKNLQTDGTSQKKVKQQQKKQNKIQNTVKQEKKSDDIDNKQKTTNQQSASTTDNNNKKQTPKEDTKNQPKNQQISNQINISTLKEETNTKIDIESLLPHETKAKVLEQVMQTRKRRSNIEALKVTSNIGSAILIIFMIGLALYLKSIISSSNIQKMINKQKDSRSPEQYDSNYARAKSNSE